jgi:hypothetical protein
MNTSSRAFKSDHPFSLLVSGCFLALVFWTFARSYYLKGFFDSPPLTPLVQVHGAVMSGWVLLLAVQSGLAATGRIRWHRYLGWLGAVWALFVIVMGSVTTLAASAREVHQHSKFAHMQLVVSGLELVQMLLFAGLVITAIALRHRPDYHKRLMLLTIVCLLPSALARLPIDFLDNRLILWVLDALVLSCVGIDAWRHRRLHPAFGWGAAAVLGVLHAAFYLSQTPAWISFGTRMVS